MNINYRLLEKDNYYFKTNIKWDIKSDIFKEVEER